MKMTPSLPSKWDVRGFLYDSPDRRGLGEDMFEAELPDGTLIDAGWSSEGDPNGTFQVSVTRGFRHVVPQFFTKDMLRAKQHIELIATMLSRSVINTSTWRVSFKYETSFDHAFQIAGNSRHLQLLIA